MVQRIALVLLGFVAVVAIGGLTVQFRDVVTGDYVKSGGGRWYYGPMRAQMQPDEACIYAGYEPVYPWQVYNNEYGNTLSVCKSGNQFVSVPLLQTIVVPPSS